MLFKINRRNIQTVHEHDVLDDVARQINEERLIFPFFFFLFQSCSKAQLDTTVDQIGFEGNHWFHRGIRRVSRGIVLQIDANRLIILR